MRLLLDEDVADPLLPIIQRILREHVVDNVYSQRWGGKQDRNLFPDAKRHGFQAVLTNDLSQLNDPDQCTIIRRSKLHLILFTIEDDLQGLALASASICAAIRPIMVELAGVTGQRIVWITAIDSKRKRHKTVNPTIDEVSPYW